MNRDEQIAAIRDRIGRLREDRLSLFRAQIYEAYQRESIVDDVSRVVETVDREPDDSRVITNSEARALGQFNNDSYMWDMYCTELGRSVAIGERAYVFETLDQIATTGEAIDSRHPQFSTVLAAVDDLIAHDFHPDTLCAPIDLFVPFSMDSTLQINWNSSPREVLLLPGRPNLKLFWSSRAAPLRQFVVFDSSAPTWKVKLDPATGQRLTVAIGEPDSPPEAVMFLSETIAKFTVGDSEAYRAIQVEGELLDPMDYANQEAVS